ncbi:MAG: glycosyltransferase family 8 protein [Endomicrobia bacterium]|nr:glycosyltransferase family 8 protein [Endomicrobiia bacterium]
MINIAFGLDDSFAPHCGATAASILVNHKLLTEEDKIHFFFFCNVSDENKEKLLKLKEIQDFDHTFINVDESEFEGLPLRNGQKIAIYNVLMVPMLLSSDVKKIIYLDCDLILNKDISELWKINTDDYPVAAVKDNYRRKPNYFNSGVMVFNIPKLKEFNYYDKWKKYVKEKTYKMILHDQDILNPVLRANTLYLPENWNVHHGIFLTLYDKYSKKNFNDFLSFCHIVHYSTQIKPWHALPVHPLKNLYFKYLAMTPWHGSAKKYPASVKIKHFCKLFLKYWYVHPAFFVKPRFWKEVGRKGWLMTLY